MSARHKTRQKRSDVVPLTSREKRQVEAQLKLAKAEVSRLKAIVEKTIVDSRKKKSPRPSTIDHRPSKPVFAPIVPLASRKLIAQKILAIRKRSDAARKAGLTRRIKKLEKELRAMVDGRLSMVEQIEELQAKLSVEYERQPQNDLQTIVPKLKKQTYQDDPIINVRTNKQGWILGETSDEFGNHRPVRGWVIFNNENKKFTVRWLEWHSGTKLPKQGIGEVDEDYDEPSDTLYKPKYFVYGVFDDSKKIEAARDEVQLDIDELESELRIVDSKIEALESEIALLRRSMADSRWPITESSRPSRAKRVASEASRS